MKKIFILFSLLICNHVYCQVVAEKELQKASENKLSVINNLGMKSNFGSLGEISNTVIGKFEVTKLKNNGFVIRMDYVFTKYDENMNKQWSTEIKAPLGLQARPTNISLGDESGFYFIMEEQYNSSEGFYVIKFDNAGKYIQQKYVTGIKNNIVASYISSTGLNIINFQYDKKAQKFIYKLISFSNTLDIKEKLLNLKMDAYETAHLNDYYILVMAWTQLKVLNNKVILSKSYYKKEKEETPEQARYITKTIEIDFSGYASAEKIITTDKANRKSPSVEISNDGKTLYLFGYLNIKNNINTDGIYVHKMDYQTNKYIYKKDIDYSNVVNSIEIEKAPINANEMYPVINFIEGSYEFNNNNDELNFIIRKSQTTALSNMSVYSLNIDSTGIVNALYEIKYPTNVISVKRYHFFTGANYVNYTDNGGFFLNPISVKKLYSSNKSDKLSPLEYIYQHADENSTVNKFWCVRKADDGYLILKISDNTSEIIGYKLK